MLKTLHLHISRELLRVMSLSLVAFTLVMTVFAVIDPLRKQGVAAASQVLVLIGCTLPMMITLTLPVAALFAATIVYGRFSQDNELMACRASGIGTLGLVKPAFVLGGVVAVITLVLMNFVTPQLAETAERSVKDNIKGIVFQQLRTQGYVKFENRYILHADRVEPEDKLYGVVVSDTRDPKNIRMCIDTVSRLNFVKIDNDTYAKVVLTKPAVLGTGSDFKAKGEQTEPIRMKLPEMVRENPSWYNWNKLLDTQRDPTMDPSIKRRLVDISRRIAHDMLCREVKKTINAGKPYELSSKSKRYVITAPRAEVNQKEQGEVDLLPALGDEDKLTVMVEEWDNGIRQKPYFTDRCKVIASWSLDSNDHIVTIELGDKVMKETPDNKEDLWRSSHALDPTGMPESIAVQVRNIKLETIWKSPEKFTNNAEILKNIDDLKNRDVPRLLRKVKAEMHIRAGYGVSFFLLVAMGAGLGMIFRGGQLLSAFTLSMAPLLITIVLLLMGKQMIGHPQVSELAGVSVIWLGILGLAIATVCVHWRLMRK